MFASFWGSLAYFKYIFNCYSAFYSQIFAELCMFIYNHMSIIHTRFHDVLNFPCVYRHVDLYTHAHFKMRLLQLYKVEISTFFFFWIIIYLGSPDIHTALVSLRLTKKKTEILA